MKTRIRMYRQGLGDCFLLTFNWDQPKPFHILIDCGTLGKHFTEVEMKSVAQNISDVTGKKIDLVIATHEHKDHLSGFRDQKAIFNGIQFKQVWVAWTEKPTHPRAIELKKYKNDLLLAMQLGAQSLRANQAEGEEKAALEATAQGIEELLAFHGDLGAKFKPTVDEAMDLVCKKAPGGMPDFLEPGMVIEQAKLPGLRFYVLGPPLDDQIKSMGKHGDSELYDLAARSAGGFAQAAALFQAPASGADYSCELDPKSRDELDKIFPFDGRYRLDCTEEETRRRYFETYDDPSAAWRKIDYDWLASSADFALQLDNLTNNTSLALAIEIIEDGRVLLFPADAQLGNWLSWHDHTFKVKGPNGTSDKKAKQLLEETVLYKVGHHASHNATLKEHGLEMMKNLEMALIPVDSEVAKNKSWKMPAPQLFKELIARTKGRVLRSDTGWPKANQRPSSISKTEWDQTRASVKLEEGPGKLFYDVFL